MTVEEAYKRGYACGRDGASIENSHFSIFSKSEYTEMWEMGKKKGEEDKKNNITSSQGELKRSYDKRNG